MKQFVVVLSFLAMAYGQMTPRDPYEAVTYRIPVDGADDQYCASVTLAGQFTVAYFKKGPDPGAAINVQINLPSIPPRNASDTPGSLSGSMCPDNTTGVWMTKLVAMFSDGEIFTMTMTSDDVSANNGPSSWKLMQLSFTYNELDQDYFPDGNGTESKVVSISNPNNDSVLGIGAGEGQLYACNSAGSGALTAEGVPEVPFSYMDMLLNPFNATDTSNEYVCDADSSASSKTVPIAVGASLGGLLLLVVLAYFIGRRMRTGGYEKV